MKQLQQMWEQGKCPIVNGIIFPDGSVVPVEVANNEGGVSGRRLYRSEGLSLQELDEQDELLETAYGEHSQAAKADGSLRAIVGEGGMGEDGFVTLLDGPDGKIKWLAFFDFANPFDGVEFRDAELLCRNNLGEVWSFPLNSPQDVQIVQQAMHGRS